MWKILLCFITILLLYAATINYIKYACNSNEKTIIKSITGYRIKGIGMASQLGFPTINVKFDRDVPCGIYSGTSQYGKCTVIIGKNDLKRADIHFLMYDITIETQDKFDIFDLTRIVNNADIIATYNKGCCN